MGVALAQFVLPAAIADRLPVGVRAAGVALAFGVSSGAVGGTAPLLADLATRADAEAFVPVYAVAWAILGVLTALGWPRHGDLSSSASRV